MSEIISAESKSIESLLLGACPEQSDELAAFWHKFEPRFGLKKDGNGLAISANGNKVTWMHKTFAHDWVVTFAGFKSLAAYAPHLWFGQQFTGEISVLSLNEDCGLSDAEQELDSLLYFAKQIGQVNDLDELDWLPEVPVPGLARESLSRVEDKACFDLACLAAAATFLHELRHVQFFAEKNAPSLSSNEERRCDDFSREMLLGKVPEYCQMNGEDLVRVKSKRLIGLACAAFSIAAAEAQGMSTAIEDTHPPLRDRFAHLVLKAEMPEEADCWTYLACLLIALLRRNKRLPDTIKLTSAKELCSELAKSL